MSERRVPREHELAVVFCLFLFVALAYYGLTP